ncbi:MAG TPA: NUDIX domain-containing protein [Iamia sp.]|nr:NUDIX domain-containing protein [Iamia sp.]
MPRPHDTPAGPNPDVRDVRIEVLSDAWYTLRRATFQHRQADGTWIEEQREAYDRGNGVAALLRDPERGTILLVRQYRLPAHLNDHPDGMLLEVPAGLIDDGEDAEEALRREIEEEVGHRVDDLTLVHRLYMSPGAVTEHLSLFSGTYGHRTRIGAGGGADDEDEHIDVVEVFLDDTRAMVADGRICDAKTVILLQHAWLEQSEASR